MPRLDTSDLAAGIPAAGPSGLAPDGVGREATLELSLAAGRPAAGPSGRAPERAVSVLAAGRPVGVPSGRTLPIEVWRLSAGLPGGIPAIAAFLVFSTSLKSSSRSSRWITD